MALKRCGMPDKDRKSRKTILKHILVICLLYIGSYAVLSCFGDYVATQSGEVRNSALFRMAVMDVREWCPKFVFGHLFFDINGKITYRGNILGVIYAPLVILDQKYIHKTKRFAFPSVETDSSG